MPKFYMPVRNTCAKCGAVLKIGDEVFAANYDEVLAGKGICKKDARKLDTAVEETAPVEEKPEE